MRRSPSMVPTASAAIGSPASGYPARVRRPRPSRSCRRPDRRRQGRACPATAISGASASLDVAGRDFKVLTRPAFEGALAGIRLLTHHACHAHVPAAPGTWTPCNCLLGRGVGLGHETLPCLDAGYLCSVSHPKLFNIAHLKTTTVRALRGLPSQMSHSERRHLDHVAGLIAAAKVAAPDRH